MYDGYWATKFPRQTCIYSLGSLKFANVGHPEIWYFDVISLQPEGHVLETIFSKMQKKGQIETRLRAKYEYLIID